MLRRPSACFCTRRGEGCSSTAVELFQIWNQTAWGNLTIRGSVWFQIWNSSAVP
jgi:hypothetical protein